MPIPVVGLLLSALCLCVLNQVILRRKVGQEFLPSLFFPGGGELGVSREGNDLLGSFFFLIPFVLGNQSGEETPHYSFPAIRTPRGGNEVTNATGFRALGYADETLAVGFVPFRIK